MEVSKSDANPNPRRLSWTRSLSPAWSTVTTDGVVNTGASGVRSSSARGSTSQTSRDDTASWMSDRRSGYWCRLSPSVSSAISPGARRRCEISARSASVSTQREAIVSIGPSPLSPEELPSAEAPLRLALPIEHWPENGPEVLGTGRSAQRRADAERLGPHEGIRAHRVRQRDHPHREARRLAAEALRDRQGRQDHVGAFALDGRGRRVGRRRDDAREREEATQSFRESVPGHRVVLEDEDHPHRPQCTPTGPATTP